jgi:hypothetical protein
VLNRHFPTLLGEKPAGAPDGSGLTRIATSLLSRWTRCCEKSIPVSMSTPAAPMVRFPPFTG